uniref:Uncharacterized protein n=1 Tax=Oryza glumipatula TaxID=40148 RepID=A0A0D9YAN1_9ORYZ
MSRVCNGPTFPSSGRGTFPFSRSPSSLYSTLPKISPHRPLFPFDSGGLPPARLVFCRRAPWVSVWSDAAAVGGGGDARSEDRWMNRRKRLVPCGGGGYIVVGDREKPAPCGGASCFVVGVRDVAVPTNRWKKLAPCGSSSWRQPDGDYRFVKRAARQRRPKVAFVAALPQLPVDPTG